MKPTKILASDIELLLQLFAPKAFELFIFDPKKKLEMNKVFEKRYFDGEAKVHPKVMINFSPDFATCKEYYFGDFDLVFDFSNKVNSIAGFNIKSFSYITNPDKSIRWIYPSNCNVPTFLNFYNSATIKAKLLSKLIHVLFKFGMQSTCKSGAFTVHFRKELKVEELIKVVPYQNYSVFTGTVGLNRKILLELNSNGRTTRFVKIALNTSSLALIKNEERALRMLEKKSSGSLVVPNVYSSADAAMCITSNIKKNDVVISTELTTTHFKALQDLYEDSITIQDFEGSTVYERISNNIQLLQKGNRFKETNSIQQKMEKIFKHISRTKTVVFSNCHADFTPWNMYLTNDKLYVYDWELSHNKAPIFFDVFHFVFQSNILLKGTDLKTIKAEIDEALKNPIVKEIIERYNVDVQFQYQIYLLSNISYYMNLYEKQEHLHLQAHWLVKIWEQALAETMPVLTLVPQRRIFIDDFFNKLSNTTYAVLKFNEGSLEKISDTSDIDILVLEDDLQGMLNYFNNQPLVNKVKVCKKSFITTVELFFNDSTYLSLDLICKFQRKWSNLFDGKKLLLSAIRNSNGIMVPDPRFDFEYVLLFYTLNKSSIPEKYKTYFMGLNHMDIFRIKNFISSEYGIQTADFERLFEYSPVVHQLIENVLETRNSNNGIESIKNKLHYVADTIIETRTRKGIVISFSGVDGAGKTSTIENVVEKLSLQFRRKVVVLRHRPSVFPILSAFKYGKEEAQKQAELRLPRMGSNNSTVQSLLRFGYYFIDYLIGQPYVYFKYLLRGYVVLYDRYYFDFINDAKRSNIALSKRVTKKLYRFISKPQINIFLYASPEIILSRKQELDKKSIVELTNDYRTLFTEYSKCYKKSKYLQIENIDWRNTLQVIMNEYSQVA